jgi:hypothetical protein
MALADRITIDVSGLGPTQIERLKKGFYPRVQHLIGPGGDYNQVSMPMVRGVIAQWIKNMVRRADEDEARENINYTNMDT